MKMIQRTAIPYHSLKFKQGFQKRHAQNMKELLKYLQGRGVKVVGRDSSFTYTSGLWGDINIFRPNLGEVFRELRRINIIRSLGSLSSLKLSNYTIFEACLNGSCPIPLNLHAAKGWEINQSKVAEHLTLYE